MSSIGLKLDERISALRFRVRRFMEEEVLPHEVGLDPEATELPPDVLTQVADKARAAGLWGLWAPKEFGGQGLGLLEQTVLLEEACRHRNGLYNPGYGSFGRIVPDICFQCTADQADRYVVPAVRDGLKTFFAMSEPAPSRKRGGADPSAGIKTRAVRDGDNWIINGVKTWISFAPGSPTLWSPLLAS
jgi:acyl-CoA dehydrogenase